VVWEIDGQSFMIVGQQKKVIKQGNTETSEWQIQKDTVKHCA
jgi:hypothetical protein